MRGQLQWHCQTSATTILLKAPQPLLFQVAFKLQIANSWITQAQKDANHQLEMEVKGTSYLQCLSILNQQSSAELMP
jgi:hypothetical protein